MRSDDMKSGDLDWQLRRLRMAAREQRSSPASRDELMQKFAAKHVPAKRSAWAWPLTIAAALALSLAVVRMPRHPAPLAAPVEETVDSSDGFIAVPFVLPLAQGELVHVVHTELHPAALAGLGVNVDPAWVTSMPADLLVGEDGSPRAVRVSNEDTGGF